MEQQILLIDRFIHQEGDQLARNLLWENKYAMWKEVIIAKRTRLDEGSDEA